MSVYRSTTYPLPGQMRRLSLADAVATGDPGTRLASAITDLGNGSGIRISLTGGWTSSDWAGAYPYIVWPLIDIAGAAIKDDALFSCFFVLRIRAHPANTSDTRLRVAILNESDPTLATVDGMSAGIEWGTSTRTAISGNVSNGTAAAVSSGAGGSATADCLQTIMAPQGVGSTRNIPAPRTCLLDSTGAYIAGTYINANPGNGIAVGNPAAGYYIAITAGRSATTAGTATIDVDAYYLVGNSVLFPS